MNYPLNKEFTCSAVIPPELSGERFDKIAAQLFDQYSRSVLKKWIQEGALRVDGQAIRAKDKASGGEKLDLEVPQEKEIPWAAESGIEFSVLYEDDELLVINKPAGLVVHPGAGNWEGTLINGLLAHRPALDQLPRAGLVHRLDKDTSGVMVVAANRLAHGALVAAIQARDVGRQYCALVERVLVSGRDIEAPIGRDPHQPLRQAVREDGKYAFTKVRVASRYRSHTEITAKLLTGRTHQIRVHLASIGHPLVGDRRYGARGRLPNAPTKLLIAQIQQFSRQALHAQRLSFVHPASAKNVRFEAPPPVDYLQLKTALEEDASLHKA